MQLRCNYAQHSAHVKLLCCTMAFAVNEQCCKPCCHGSLPTQLLLGCYTWLASIAHDLRVHQAARTCNILSRSHYHCIERKLLRFGASWPYRTAVLRCRCSIQLTILGYILVPIFSYDRWWLVIIYASFMITVAAAEAVSRPHGAYQVSSHMLCCLMLQQLRHWIILMRIIGWVKVCCGI